MQIAMLKIISTLLRGTVAEIEETVLDANAIRLLEQQIREAAAGLEQARRELACVMAHQSSESRAAAALSARIAELETSGVAALRDGADAIASEVAAAIAVAEDERTERHDSAQRLDADITRLRRLADQGRRRLMSLRRGLELARAQDALSRAGASGRRTVMGSTGPIREAESTLARIRERQAGALDADSALDSLDREAEGKCLDERLANAGYGARPTTRPDAVLERMRRAAGLAQSAPPSAG
jgi:phage shock protein A